MTRHIPTAVVLSVAGMAVAYARMLAAISRAVELPARRVR